MVLDFVLMFRARVSFAINQHVLRNHSSNKHLIIKNRYRLSQEPPRTTPATLKYSKCFQCPSSLTEPRFIFTAVKYFTNNLFIQCYLKCKSEAQFQHFIKPVETRSKLIDRCLFGVIVFARMHAQQSLRICCISYRLNSHPLTRITEFQLTLMLMIDVKYCYVIFEKHFQCVQWIRLGFMLDSVAVVVCYGFNWIVLCTLAVSRFVAVRC